MSTGSDLGLVGLETGASARIANEDSFLRFGVGTKLWKMRREEIKYNHICHQKATYWALWCSLGEAYVKVNSNGLIMMMLM